MSEETKQTPAEEYQEVVQKEQRAQAEKVGLLRRIEDLSAIRRNLSAQLRTQNGNNAKLIAQLEALHVSVPAQPIIMEAIRKEASTPQGFRQAVAKSFGGEICGKGKGGGMSEETKQTPADLSAVTRLVELMERQEKERAKDMKTEKDAITVMFSAWQRLHDLGWKDACYCPKDGSLFHVIEPGSTGIHVAHYSGEWPNGTWWIHADNDLCPSRPILFKPIGAK